MIGTITGEDGMNKKQTKKVVAATLAMSMLVGGTFAWQSYSQRVVNETAGVDGNVGARLHNDFNGSNTDVYVENYAADGGNEIYTRARVHEYMEYGIGAGTLTEDNRPGAGIVTIRGDKEVASETPSIDYPDTWDIYLFDQDSQINSDINIREFISVNHGDLGNSNRGSKIYMPTFNKDFDDLTADIKGSILDSGDRYNSTDKYSEYKSYTIGESLEMEATYNERSDVAISEGTTQVNEIHIAKSTLEGSVISMSDWNDEGSTPGDFWVYDVDGWAYWANGVAPGDATSLLVDSLLVSKPLTIDWYYGLHVEMEAATAGDWGDQSSLVELEQGMYSDITSDGIFLLNTVAGISPLDGVSMMSMEWMMGGEIFDLEVEVATIDGVAFYVLDRTTITSVDEEGYSTGREEAALLLAVDSIGEYPYDTQGGVTWSESNIRNVVLEEWLSSQETLSRSTVRVPVVTDGYYESHEDCVSTELIDEVTYDRVFLLSQMEILSTYGLNHTYMAQSLGVEYNWLRTPSGVDVMRQLDAATGLISDVARQSTATAGVRPAMWVVL